MNRHIVEEGEKLSDIAGRYGLDVRDVLAANPQKARLALPSGVQVFQSLSAGEDIEIPGTLGSFGSFVKTYSGYNAAKSAVEKVMPGDVGPTATFTEEEKMTGGCAEGYRYDPTTQTCVRKLPKIAITAEARARKEQEKAVRAALEAQAAATAQAESVKSSSMKKKLLIGAGVVGVLALGVGGAVWALKK